MVHFHAIGNWDESAVSIERVASSRAMVSSVEAIIDRTWRDAMARQEQSKIQLFDGPMCRLESFSWQDDRLHVRVSDTSYRIFYGTNLTHPGLATTHGDRVLARPLGVSAAPITCDGFLVLGRRNESVAYYPNRLHPFAGAMEPCDRLSAFDAVRRELREELSLEAADLTGLRCVGLVEDRQILHPEMIFTVRTVQSRAQI